MKRQARQARIPLSELFLKLMKCNEASFEDEYTTVGRKYFHSEM